MYFFTALLSFIVKNAAPIAPGIWAPKVNNYHILSFHTTQCGTMRQIFIPLLLLKRLSYTQI